MLEVLRAVTGEYATNCYILRDTDSGDCAAVDCAVYDAEYRDFLARAGVEKLKYIILTHGHFDHICGVSLLRKALGGEVCIFESEADCLYDEKRSLVFYDHRFPGYEPCRADRLLRDGDRLPFGDGEIRVMHTPGHTSGSICLFAGDKLFSGDTLFRLSMGRTDLPTGSTRQLFASLRALGATEGDFTVYPGHGEPTTLAFEKKYNRYLRSGQYDG